MENVDNLRITINNFRAISDADISLNGITVLSGTNGTGKSTISRLVYHIIQSANEYSTLVFSELRHNLQPYIDAFESFAFTNEARHVTRSPFRELFFRLNFDSEVDIDQFLKRIDQFCNRIAEYELDESSRFYKILQRTLDFEDGLPFANAIDLMKEKISLHISSAVGKINNRPSQVLNDAIRDDFGEDVINNVTVFEYGECLFGLNCESVPLPHFIKNSFYINTPFILEMRYSSSTARRLLSLLTKDNSEKVQGPISSFITDQIILGEARFKEENVSSGFRFVDKLGNEFDLEECATGIKAFSIIQLLLNSGQIRKDTLLILDEPEAHLHPQWIVEYAKLIVLMHKSLGVSFLISTHSTDMVSAIKYISEAESCSDKLSYYCSSPSKMKGKYRFDSIGTDIEPIFYSFNKSYDALERYAGQ